MIIHITPTIGGRLLYHFGSSSYGSYPEIQPLWEQYKTEINPKVRRELIVRIQNLIHEKAMLASSNRGNSPVAIGPKGEG